MDLSLIASQATFKNKKIRHGKRTADAVRKAVLEEYHNNSHETVREIAMRHGVGVATIYRWKAQQEQSNTMTVNRMLELARNAKSLRDCAPIMKHARQSGVAIKKIAEVFDTTPKYVSKLVNS